MEKVLSFLEKRPLTVKFSKFCCDSFHRDTDRRVVFKFREIWPTGSRWNRALLTWQKFPWLSNCRYTARIAPKISPGQPRQCTQECSRFHPNRFTFGGVIAARVNTAKMLRKVNPIYDCILASSRIIIIMHIFCPTPLTATNFFAHRVVKYWNFLPADVVDFTLLSHFRQRSARSI